MFVINPSDTNREYKISFRHEIDHENGGGLTQCFIEAKSPSGEWVRHSSGIATCVKEDNYDRRIGRKLSLARALSAYDRDFRSDVWEAYFRNCKL